MLRRSSHKGHLTAASTAMVLRHRIARAAGTALLTAFALALGWR
jgi:hypothetical protein